MGYFGHGYTYSGHPVSAAVALETLRIYREDGVIDNARRVGAHLQAGLRALGDHPLVGEARGIGMIGALELAEDKAARKPFDPARGIGARVLRSAMDRGLILRNIPGDIIAFSPPLITTEAEVDQSLALTRQALDEIWAWLRAQG
jgi:4-aminobutyrate--pyruvate transaminase